MRVIVFGTYDASRHPRIRVLIEGLRKLGEEVTECNIPLGVDTAARVEALRRPWKAATLAVRLAAAWVRLWRKARTLAPADVVVVGYLGVFDVHLARRLWPNTIVVLDQLAFVGDIARDRRLGGRRLRRWLDAVDVRAMRRADVVLVDTPDNLGLIPGELRSRGLVALVGAPESWFQAAKPAEGSAASQPLRVVFYGLYTPLQGAPVIGAAIARCPADIEFTMIGRGQDLAATRTSAGSTAAVTWLDWVAPDELPTVVAAHDVCLGIFGDGDKARRVVPNKVYQGAAAGCAIVTADTAAQRAALGDDALFVASGDAEALATELASLAADRSKVARLRERARTRAAADFRPEAVAAPLLRHLQQRIDQ